jgi:hypothetical protein
MLTGLPSHCRDSNRSQPVVGTEGSPFYRGTRGFMAVILTAKEMHVEVIEYTGASSYQTRVQNRAVDSEA